MMSPRQHWTFVLAHLLYLAFVGVFFMWTLPELVSVLLAEVHR